MIYNKRNSNTLPYSNYINGVTLDKNNVQVILICKDIKTTNTHTHTFCIYLFLYIFCPYNDKKKKDDGYSYPRKSTDSLQDQSIKLVSHFGMSVSFIDDHTVWVSLLIEVRLVVHSYSTLFGHRLLAVHWQSYQTF